MSAVINMDDPLAPPPRDTPPSPKDPADAPPAPAGSTAPRRGRKAGDAQLKLDLKEIEEKLGNLLELPGIPMAAAGDVWPAQHIERHAHPLAKAIANACKDNPQLRAKLLQLLRVSDNASLAVAVFSYLVPILLYYGLLPVPPIVRAQLQVPDRNEPGVRSPSIAEQLREQALRSQHGEQADPPPATNEPPPPGQPPPPRAASAI